MKWLFATRGSGPGRLASVARNVTYAGTTIGTFTGGTGGTDLVITLNTNADATAVSALVQNITYENTDTSQPHAGHPHRPLCAHRWGWGHQRVTTTPPSTFTADNDAPVITNLGSDNLAYTEGDGAVVIDQSTAAAVSDVDSSNFDTGTLTVAFTAGSRTVPRMKWLFATRGSGPGRLASVARNVTYAGTTIGTFTGGTGGTDLVITLNTNADATAVSALVQNITYENTDTSQPHAGHPHRPLCA